VLKPLDMRYAQRVNWTHGIKGRLWRGRFCSCVWDEENLWAAIRYVERNSVLARIARKAENYALSSAAAHCGVHEDPILSPLPKGCPVKSADWSVCMAEGDDARMLAMLRLHTCTGRPAGSRRFVVELESKLGRNLRAKPVGRPRKRKDESTQCSIHYFSAKGHQPTEHQEKRSKR
jgi:putative transposase